MQSEEGACNLLIIEAIPDAVASQHHKFVFRLTTGERLNLGVAGHLLLLEILLLVHFVIEVTECARQSKAAVYTVILYESTGRLDPILFTHIFWLVILR